MNFNNDNEVLDFFYRLLDMLHQADLQNFGSHIQLVYVAPGAQHVDHIQTQYFGERLGVGSNIYLFIHILAAWGIDEHGAALVIFVCTVQLLQQFVHLIQDIGGQHVAESAQKAWDFFIVIHIHVSVKFLIINTYNTP